MNMFARFDENPAKTLQDIKERKYYGRTDGQRENSIPTTNKVCGGYNKNFASQRQNYAQKMQDAQVTKSLEAKLFCGISDCPGGNLLRLSACLQQIQPVTGKWAIAYFYTA